MTCLREETSDEVITQSMEKQDVDEVSPSEPGQPEMISVGVDAVSQIDQKTQRIFPALRLRDRKLANYSLTTFPLTGHLVIMLSWIMIMTYIIAFTWRQRQAKLLSTS